MRKLRLQFSAIESDYHINYLQHDLKTQSGIINFIFNRQTRQALIYFDPLTANLAHLRAIIENAGLHAEPIIHQPMQSYLHHRDRLCEIA